MLYYVVVERWMNFDFCKKKYIRNSSENGDMSSKKEGKTSRLKLMAWLSNGL